MRNRFQLMCSLFRFFLLYCLQKIPKRINNLFLYVFYIPFSDWLSASCTCSWYDVVAIFPTCSWLPYFSISFFFGNDRCICRINRLHHLTVHQINLSLKIWVSNTTFHNDRNSFQSSTLPFCCVLYTQGLWTFIISILTRGCSY